MQFIKATNKYCTLKENIPAPIFRKTFEIDSEVRSARLDIATPGFYELYVNGENITHGLLAPYIANPDHLVYLDSYDLAPYLRVGGNAVAVILGNGFANQDVDGWEFKNAAFRAPLCVALSAQIVTEKGTASIISDESFKVSTSPILFDMYRYGIVYDAREERDGFASFEYDDSGWDHAISADAPKGKITLNRAKPIRVRAELRPVRWERQSDFYCLHYKDGRPMKECYIKDGYLFDFGVNTAGVCRLRIKGEAGQRITVRHGETLRDGLFDIGSTVTVKEGTERTIDLLQHDVYYLKGGEEEILSPSFTYHGFRYAFVEGITEEQLHDDLITYAVFSTDVNKRSHFECSDEVLNRLYQISINADLSNFHHFPTDCPHREKNGWTGDVALSAEQLLLSFDCKENLTVWLESLRCAQLESGMLPGISPTTGWGYKWGNGPFWDQAATVVPYFIHKYDGDLTAMSESADMISRYLRYIAGRRDGRGLVEVGLGDWVQPGCVTHGITAPLCLTDSLTVYDIADKAEYIFKKLARSEDERFARELKTEIRSAIKTHLIDRESATAKGDCQTSQALLLHFGMFDESDRERAFRRLLEIIENDKRHLNTGVIGLKCIFDVLISGGECDLALEMISRPDEPSYGAMLTRGATALCESLDVNGLNESENHHFLGDIIRVFISLIAGLKLTSKDSFIFEPHVPTSLEYARAEYVFSHGKALCGWEKCEGSIRFYTDVPEGVSATFRFSDVEMPLSSGHNEFVI